MGFFQQIYCHLYNLLALNNTIQNEQCCVFHLSSEVSAHGGQVVELCEDLPEDLFIHLAAAPPVEFWQGVGVKVHVTDHQGETPRGGVHSVWLARDKVEGGQVYRVITGLNEPHNRDICRLNQTTLSWQQWGKGPYLFVVAKIKVLSARQHWSAYGTVSIQAELRGIFHVQNTGAQSQVKGHNPHHCLVLPASTGYGVWIIKLWVSHS